MTKLMATHIIRVAGVLIENNQLLIIEQNIGEKNGSCLAVRWKAVKL